MSSTAPSKEISVIPARSADMKTKVYKGGCHCGKFQFECRHPVLEDGFEVVSCNCSLCTQRGCLLIYIFDPTKDFRFLKGTENELTHYKFNRKVVSHMFCPVCGSGFISKGDASLGNILVVNARALFDVDMEKLNLKMGDGRNI